MSWLLMGGCSDADVAAAIGSDADQGSDAGEASPPSDAGGWWPGSDPALVPFEPGAELGCGVLRARLRDFKTEHPDFEGNVGGGVTAGIVQPRLGPDLKPIYAPAGATNVTSGPEPFADWYNDRPGVNQAFDLTIALSETASGSFVYQSSAFFPLDGQGFGNEYLNHNFHFTTEIHTRFVYRGGERFTFEGDDDLWLFINGVLAIDLGGVHARLSATIDLDAQAELLGIARGTEYAMDVFHAERHTGESNFRIETTIDCFTPVLL